MTFKFHYKTLYWLKISFLASSLLFNASAIAEKFYTVPLELIDNTPYLTIELEGKQTSVILDTGASFPLSLSQEVLRSCNDITYTGDYSRSIDAANKVFSSRLFKLKNINLAKFHPKNIIGKEYQPWGIYVSDNGETKEVEENIDKKEKGIMGLRFFQNNNLIIDYSKNQIIILEKNAPLPSSYAQTKWHSAPLTLSQEGLIIEGMVKNLKGNFLIDTGATRSFLRKTKRLIEINMKNDNTFDENIIIADEYFGPLKFQLLSYSQPEVDGVLGYDFFMQHIVYLDFENKLFKLTKANI